MLLRLISDQHNIVILVRSCQAKSWRGIIDQSHVLRQLLGQTDQREELIMRPLLQWCHKRGIA